MCEWCGLMGRMHACIYLIRGRQPVYLDHTRTHTCLTSELAHPDTRARRAPLRVSGPRLRGRAVAREHRSPRHRGAAGGGLSPSLDPTSTCHNSQSLYARGTNIFRQKNSHKAHYQFLLSHALHSYSTEGVAARTSTSFLHKSNGSGASGSFFFLLRGGFAAPPRYPYGNASVSSTLPPSACARASRAASTRSCRVSAATETAHRSRVLRVCSACSLSRGAR